MRVVLATLLLALAGCTDPAQPAGDAGTVTEDEPDPLAEPPVWAIGQWFRYSLTTVEGPVTWVVTEDAGDHWVVDVDHETLRFFHDAFGQVSTVGSIGKSDLQGSQDHGEIRFLDFPLEENKTWSLTWDTIEWEATVVDVTDATAEVVAEDGTGAQRVYIYDADVGWFRSMAAYDVNGTLVWEASFEQGGSGYSGEYVRWDVHDRYDLSVRPGPPIVAMFDVPEGATDIWYSIAIFCSPEGVEGDQGTGSLDIQPESGQGGISRQDVCVVEDALAGTLEPTPGSWGVTGTSTGTAYEGVLIPRTLATLTL